MDVDCIIARTTAEATIVIVRRSQRMVHMPLTSGARRGIYKKSRSASASSVGCCDGDETTDEQAASRVEEVTASQGTAIEAALMR